MERDYMECHETWLYGMSWNVTIWNVMERDYMESHGTWLYGMSWNVTIWNVMKRDYIGMSWNVTIWKVMERDYMECHGTWLYGMSWNVTIWNVTERDYMECHGTWLYGTQPKCVQRYNFHSNQTILNDNLYETSKRFCAHFDRYWLNKYRNANMYNKSCGEKWQRECKPSSFFHVSLKQFDIKKQNMKLIIPLYFIACLILLHMVHGI